MKADTFEELLTSVREGGAILRGEKDAARETREEEVDVKNIRAKLNLSQPQFAALIGISVATVRNWEQGRRKPEGPARVLLQIAKTDPAAIVDSIQRSTVHISGKPTKRRKKQLCSK